MSKIYKIKYLICHKDDDNYTLHEYTYMDKILDRKEAIALAKIVIALYISCSDEYTTFVLNDHHFGAYRECQIGKKADEFRVWVE